MTVAGLLLAGGAGRRFGGPKALVRLDGELLVERGVRLLRDGGCAPVVVVLGAQAERVRAVAELPIVVVAEDWATGMGASLRAGLAALAGAEHGAVTGAEHGAVTGAEHVELTGAEHAALTGAEHAALTGADIDACVVALVDQPLVGAAAITRLRAAYAAGATAAVATYGGRPRNPVLLDRSTWSAVSRAAVGDTGARGWLRAHPGAVSPVACDGTGSPDDLDTPEDLAALAELAQRVPAR